MVTSSVFRSKFRLGTPLLLHGKLVSVKAQVSLVAHLPIDPILADVFSGCGSIVGTIINGWLVQAFGPRKVLLCTLCVMSCFLFIVFFAPSKEVLLVGEILLGFEWGIVSRKRFSMTIVVPLLTHTAVRHHRPSLRFRGPAPSAPRVLYVSCLSLQVNSPVLRSEALYLLNCFVLH